MRLYDVHCWHFRSLAGYTYRAKQTGVQWYNHKLPTWYFIGVKMQSFRSDTLEIRRDGERIVPWPSQASCLTSSLLFFKFAYGMFCECKTVCIFDQLCSLFISDFNFKVK